MHPHANPKEKRKMKKNTAGRDIAAAAVLAVAAAIAPVARSKAQIISIVPDEDVSKIEKIAGDTFGERAKDSKKPRILVFFKCEGFCHNRAISYGLKALETASRKGAFSMDATADYGFLSAGRLAGYDGLVLLNCTNPDTKNHPNLEKDLVNFVKGGKGLCVVHAGCDGFYDAPEASDMIGGRFWDHPWFYGPMWSIENVKPEHPVNRAFKSEGPVFKRKEEIYQHSTPPYDPSKVQVLLSLDLKDEATAARFAEYKGHKRDDGQFPVSWVKEYGKGRVFYTTLGHESNTYVDPASLGHIFDGLRWTLGEIR